MSRLIQALLGATVVVLALAAGLLTINLRGEPDVGRPETFRASPAQIERGAYLARAGNCIHCHTERGGAAMAGGRGVATPFGTVYSSNLTPDADNGLGRWTSADFFRALHNGRSKGGRLLYPAFPYPNFTIVTRADSDALFAWLQSLPPVAQPNRAHALRWPYAWQAALAAWRALYFEPGTFKPDPARSAEWNRGAYLARGLGHCAACHGARDSLGGIGDPTALEGGMIPMQGWYAPALGSAAEAGVADWPLPEIVQLLKTGVAPRGIVTGPMAAVVQHSTQSLTHADLTALATWLKALPHSGTGGADAIAPAARSPAATATAQLGAKLYDKHCADCHGDDGQGRGIAGLNGYSAYPPLAGNRAVTMADSSNLVQMLLYGGFPPATAGNPRPFGMPPFVLILSNAEIAAVLSYIRSAWGNRAGPVTELNVGVARSPQQR